MAASGFESARARFVSRVSVAGPGECWLWHARLWKSGYGSFSVNGRDERAHRVAWALANGPIPEGMCVLHRCDNPPCCNPAHLFLGTPAVNARDRSAKGRSATGARHGSRTHPEMVPCMKGERNPSAKLTARVVRKIRDSFTGRLGEMSEFAVLHGVSVSTVSNILAGKVWKQV
jgi:hypothetical protein